MKKLRNRKYAFLLTMLLFLSALSGCGSDSTPKAARTLTSSDPIIGTLRCLAVLKPYLRYTRTLLPPEQQVYYDRFAYAALEMREQCVNLGTDKELVHQICGYVINDFPEAFWLDYVNSPGGVLVYRNEAGNICDTGYRFNYAMTPEEAAETKVRISEAAEKCTAPIGENASDYEKIKCVYDCIVNNTAYYAGYHLDQSALGVLLDGKGVCAGYARASQYLLQKLGIMATIVSGSAGGGSHMWNIVECEGEYYHLDTMWGDPLYKNAPKNYISYAYLLDTTEYVLRTHTITTAYPLPECTATKYNYYAVNGSLLKRWDADLMAQAVAAAYSRGENYAQFRFVDSAAYRAGVGGSCSEVIQLARDYGSSFSTGSYRREVNSDELTLEMWFF